MYISDTGRNICINCSLNALFSFYLFMVYIPECKQQLKNYEIIHQKYGIFHALNLGFGSIILRQPCNSQRPRCDIAWLYVTNHLYHGFTS